MFSRRIPLADLVEFCRTLRHNLGAGLSLVKVMTQQGQRGPRSVRPVAARVSDALRGGSSLADALRPDRDAFPPLFLTMVALGEETGHMPEIFRELEGYFLLEWRLGRQFRNQTLPTVIQFALAVLLVAGLIFILGTIAASTNSRPLLAVFGLSGAAGAAVFLGSVIGAGVTAWLLYVLVGQQARHQVGVDRVLLRLPVLGPCLEALALARFTLALQLTLDSGLPITKALRLSLAATGNGAYAAGADGIVGALKGGQPLHEALEQSRLFPPDFLDVVASAEEGGRVPEVMRHQAEYYQEEASRRLTLLTRAAGGLVWVAYAGFMIWAIFRIASVYLGVLAG